MHLVQQISEAIQQVLTGLPTTEGRVHVDRPRQLSESDLPALIIEIGDDPATPMTKFYPRLMAHTMQLSVLVLVKASTTATVLHQIRLEVERAMAAAAPSLSGLTKDMRSLGAGRREQDNEGDLPAGLLPINFEIDYRHLEDNPEVAQ